MNRKKVLAYLLLTAGFLLLFAIPVESHPHYFTVLMVTKALAIVFGTIGVKLHQKVSVNR